ncbi:uncharacterized protein LOC121390744 isoform X2 [Gigantopelta aegis]|nr:uncharacterized protein LOC121390744 isoform X2 [Gigantopelta aegis]
MSEHCNHRDNCTVTGCSLGGNIECDDDNICTCHVADCLDGEKVGVGCGSQGASFCYNWYNSATKHNCDCADLNNLHCIDGKCRCGYPPNS